MTMACTTEKMVGLRGLHRYYSMTKMYLGHSLFLLVGLNLLAAAVESIGILLFIPFLSELSGAATPTDRSTLFLSAAFALFNIRVTVEHTLLAVVLAFSLKGVTVFCLNAFRPIFINGIRHRIRQRLIALYAEVDYRYSMDKSSGFFANLLMSETDKACIAMEWFCRALTALLTVLALLATAFSCYRLVSLLMVIIGIISLMLLRRFSARAKAYSLQLTALSARMNEFLIQTLQSHKYLKVTGRFAPLQEQLSRISTASRRIHNKMAVVNSLQSALQEPILVICLAGLAYSSVILAGESLPAVMVVGLFFYRCMIEMGHFNNHWQVLSSNMGGLEMIWKTEESLQRHQEENGSGTSYQFQESIVLTDVAYAFDATHPVVQGVNMILPKHGSVALVGVSGAGKTTIIDIITGLLKPGQGTVCIDGQDLGSLDMGRYRRSIGYVGQETVLFDTSIAGNISMQWDQSMAAATLARVKKAAQDSYCDEFIGRLPQGYQTAVGERGIRLSGGQRQRLAIARELFKNPDILILDEATSSLDSQSEKYIWQSIERIKGSMTLLIISHRLSTIINADVIYVLDRGRVVEQGTFADLSRNEGTVFRRMCALQRLV